MLCRIDDKCTSARRIPASALGILLILVATGCATTCWRKLADREVYKLIRKRSAAVPNMDPNFTIERKPLPELTNLPQVSQAEEFLGEAGASEVGAHIVSLEQALLLAVNHNREYQRQKEDLYLRALSLTSVRHRFRPRFRGGASGRYKLEPKVLQEYSTTEKMARDAPMVVGEIGNLVGTSPQLLARYQEMVQSTAVLLGATGPHTEVYEFDERSVEGTTSFGVDMLMKGGADIALDLSSNFLRYLTGDPRVATSSALQATIMRPLLRGAGRKIAAEQLTQAQRDLLYQLRRFTDYRKDFAIEIAAAYYGVLQARDTARNNWLGYQAFLNQFRRQQALAAEGRLTQADLGRSEQAKLDAELGLIEAIRRYKQQLDEFKIDLGLSADAPVVLDDGELKQLSERGLVHPDIKPEDAERIALAARLDVYTTRDQVEDAKRRLKVAADALKPGLNLVVTGDMQSKPGTDRFNTLDWERATVSAGLDLELPLDRKAQRNEYRAALIDFDRAQRELALFEDNVKLAVREDWRTLDQAKRTYEIRKIGVNLNERRVEEQNLRAELGRATVLDQIDAQNDLIAARNGLTAALINHTVSRLRFWRNMGILFIKEDGRWEEVTEVATSPGESSGAPEPEKEDTSHVGDSAG